MRVQVQRYKMRSSSMDLLSLSRTLRQARAVVDSVEKGLRNLSELDEVRYKIRRQEDNLELLTSRMVRLSASLNEIAEAYGRTEEKNEATLEDAPLLRQGAVFGQLYGGASVGQSIRRILE